MIDPRLFVPLSCLPELPYGAPVAHPMSQTGDVPDWTEPDPDFGIYLGCPDFDGVRARFLALDSFDGRALRYPVSNVYLDLNPPDPDGECVLRVDGLDVALRLLGRGDTGYAFCNGNLVIYPEHGAAPRLAMPPRPVDHRDPLALRLVVAELLRCGGTQ